MKDRKSLSLLFFYIILQNNFYKEFFIENNFYRKYRAVLINEPKNISSILKSGGKILKSPKPRDLSTKKSLLLHIINHGSFCTEYILC